MRDSTSGTADGAINFDRSACPLEPIFGRAPRDTLCAHQACRVERVRARRIPISGRGVDNNTRKVGHRLRIVVRWSKTARHVVTTQALLTFALLDSLTQCQSRWRWRSPYARRGWWVWRPRGGHRCREIPQRRSPEPCVVWHMDDLRKLKLEEPRKAWHAIRIGVLRWRLQTLPLPWQGRSYLGLLRGRDRGGTLLLRRSTVRWWLLWSVLHSRRELAESVEGALESLRREGVHCRGETRLRAKIAWLWEWERERRWWEWNCECMFKNGSS